MSHEIYENDQVVLGNNTPAWHGLGQIFGGLLSPLRAYIEGVGAREMSEAPVYANGIEVEGYKAIIGRYSNGATTALSVVGEGYGLLKDSNFFETLEKVYGGRACVETAGTLRNGRRIWALVKRDAWCVGPDAIQTYDLWVNRHDGSGCFELHRTNIRVVCSNTWNAAIGSGRARVFGVRHTVNVESGISQAIKLVETVDAAQRAEQAKAQRLASVAMGHSQAKEFFRDLLGAKEDDTGKMPSRVATQLDALSVLFLRGTGNAGATRWDAFNAVTEFTDHSRTVRATGGRSKIEARFESVLLGSGDDLKARAFDLLAV
jgi:phage/plasmid-like protein (TIGR03299 family)